MHDSIGNQQAVVSLTGFYVFGGGRGHLTRVRRFIDQLQLKNVLIYTGNQDARLFFRPSEIVLFEGTRSSTAAELAHFLAKDWSTRHFDHFYVDCFPFGILHEIPYQLLSATHIHYLARRLKTAAYAIDGRSVSFSSTYIFEPLEANHQTFVEQNSNKLYHFDFKLPVITGSPHISISSPYWLIIHSSHENEVALLLLKALQMMESESRSVKCLLVSDCCPVEYRHEVIWLKDESEPSKYFANAEKIISGAGFNTMQELRKFHNKHICVPFERKFDDQKWRSTKKYQ